MNKLFNTLDAIIKGSGPVIEQYKDLLANIVFAPADWADSRYPDSPSREIVAFILGMIIFLVMVVSHLVFLAGTVMILVSLVLLFVAHPFMVATAAFLFFKVVTATTRM